MDPAAPQPFPVTIFQGETVHLQPSFRSYGQSVDLTGATATLYYQTNGMGRAFWSVPATVEAGALTATFAPAQDIGAPQYLYYIGIEHGGTSYRAHGLITMRPSPGYSPSALPPPPAIWVTPAELQAVSNALAQAMQELDLGGGVLTESDPIAIPRIESLERALEHISAHDALRLIQADTNAWITIEHGTGWLHRVTFDTDTIIITATEGNNAHLQPGHAYRRSGAYYTMVPPIGDLNEEPDGDLNTLSLEAGYWIAINIANIGAGTPPGPVVDWYELADWRGPAPLPTTMLPDDGGDAQGTYTIDYLPITNRTQILTRDYIDTYYLQTNAWIEVDRANNVASIYAPTNQGAPPSLIWSSREAENIDLSFTNSFAQAILLLQQQMPTKADKSWGKYAPGGHQNPAYPTALWLDTPLTVIAGGSQWAVDGSYAVLTASESVAFISDEGGALRIGPGGTNHFGYVEGGRYTVGAHTDGIKSFGAGSPGGYVELTYHDTGGDPPVIIGTSALGASWVEEDGVIWRPGADATIIATVPAEDYPRFWTAYTTIEAGFKFLSTMPIEARGGIYGTTNAAPIVYDATIQIKDTAGKTYRIPAQKVP